MAEGIFIRDLFIEDSATLLSVQYLQCDSISVTHFQVAPSSGKGFLMPGVQLPSIRVLSKPIPQDGKSLLCNPFTLQLNLYTVRA